MRGNKQSITWLNEYLENRGIDLDAESVLGSLVLHGGETVDLPEDIVLRIISEAYDLDRPFIERFASHLEKSGDTYLFWLQKEYVKRYMDYGDQSDLEKLRNLLSQDFPGVESWVDELESIRRDYGASLGGADSAFLEKLREEMDAGNSKRVLDYLTFLYSRLAGLNENRSILLKNLFSENQEEIRKNVSETGFRKLKGFCDDHSMMDRREAVDMFSSEYLRILREDDGSAKKKSLVYINIDQGLFDRYGSEEAFYDALLAMVSRAYDDLQNHKTLSVHIGDVMHNGINIKWQIYSTLTTYAENFRVFQENRPYYSPALVCRDYLEHRYGIEFSRDMAEELSRYYKGRLEFGDLGFLQGKGVKEEELDSFRKILTGFSFVDAYVLVKHSNGPNTEEISFIGNSTELLLIFTRHEVDDRKLPCPVCGSFRISGNSFPEVGIRSWECKNPMCFERSKTNRGKRYSLRSNLMQSALKDLSDENIIPRGMIGKWRKDVVRNWDSTGLFTMLVKYFSFAGDLVATVNCGQEDEFRETAGKCGRRFTTADPVTFAGDIQPGIYRSFFSGSALLKRFMYDAHSMPDGATESPGYRIEERKANFIQGDSADVLKSFKDGSIHNMITSPPYFNAREYSQWGSYYQYLNDMYRVISTSIDKLVDGGVFFYNIGDTYGNTGTTIKSKMGEKRIALGAYTILLFRLAGFELLDNIIWDKGETQSNRHKNDGKFTPYYQRPANCYEHTFIFRKKGNVHLNADMKENILSSNVQEFSPVIKIGQGGENRYGHTAPFPEKLPMLSVKCFTSEGEKVLDPYSGSGTTSITAARNGRTGIGIEKNSQYYELSLIKAKDVCAQSRLTLWGNEKE